MEMKIYSLVLISLVEGREEVNQVSLKGLTTSTRDISVVAKLIQKITFQMS